ncbi:MAG: hypothetical protein K0Q87_4852, partial [Neobacillus sp.]|nr:hypothetical protein [Neobacillus sp.]
GKTNIKWGGFVRDIDKYDADFFGISPREAELMDPQQRMFMETVWKTIEDAGYKSSDLWGSNTGVFVGVATFDYAELLNKNKEDVEAHTSTGLFHSVLANRISYYFNFHGPSEPVNTACSSSLVAIYRAVEALRNGSCEVAIAGGVNALITPTWFVSFNRAGMLSTDGRCKTFDENANGYVRGEGSGAVLLKPLSKAIEDGDHIYGVIRGCSVNHGGRANSLTAPNQRAQTDLLLSAYRQAKISPDRVGYIETHGTGTSLGDPIEINSLKKAFEQLYDDLGLGYLGEKHCILGAVKTNIGHLEGAAGMAGLMKVLLCLKHKKIPSNLHFSMLNPYIKLEGSPFIVADKCSDWIAKKDSSGMEYPRVAGVSSFGFGGVNAHLVVEEYKGILSTVDEEFDPVQVISLSAKNEDRLRAYADQLLKYVESLEDLPHHNITLKQIAYTLQVGREPMEERLALTVSSIENLNEKLRQYCSGESSIEGVARGRISKGKQNNGLLGDDEEEGKEYIKLLIQNKKLLKLSQLWVLGFEIDWRLLYKKMPQKITLPTYPFEKHRHWFDGSLRKENSNDVSIHTEKEKKLVNDISLLNVDGMIQERYTKDDLKGVTMKVNDFQKISLTKLEPVNPKTIDSHFKSESENLQLQTISPASYRSNEATVNLRKKLKTLLADTLYIEENAVKVDICFTDLGLDSILLIEFVKKINKEFKIDLKSVKIYDYSCINTLADYLATIIDDQVVSDGDIKNTDSVESTEIENKEFENKKISKTAYPRDDSFTYTPKEQTEKLELGYKKSNDVAIIGISGKFAGTNNLEEYWNNLKNGVSSITVVPGDRWNINELYDPDIKEQNKTNCKWGGFLSNIDHFDSLFFNISPTEAELMDPQQRIFLENAWRALEDAGYSAKILNEIKCGVYVGVMGNDYNELLLKDQSLVNQAKAMTGNSNSILAARIAYLLNLKGPAIQLDTACSSSLVAAHLACQSLINGETDMMLAGGVSLYLTENSYIKMSNAGMLSSDGKCKTFDNKADGFVPGEGVGVVVLKLLENAIRDNDHIYGVIKGSGINQDGKTNGITAPSAESQKALELEVYRKFNINPESISYVEAHGTGTKLGDPIEVQALSDAFKVYTDKLQFCGIGAVKTNIGHTSAAAGVASLIKVLLSFAHKQIPPSLNFEEENDHIGFRNTPFYVNTQLREWKSSTPRRAAVSSFGFSGTNAHLVLEEY